MVRYDFIKTLQQVRHVRYYRNKPPVDLLDEKVILQFIEDVGFCPLSPNRRYDLPNLRTFQQSESRFYSDQIVKGRLAFYGRAFRRKSGFIAFDILPSLYRLSPACTYSGDRFDLYQDHYLSAAANRIAGVVAAQGPISTRELRRAVGMASPPQKHRFWRQLAEVQWRFLVVKTGVTLDDEKNYIYQWDSFDRVYQDYANEGMQMESLEAGMSLIERFINTTIASTSKLMANLFYLNEHFIDFSASKLQEEDRLTSKKIKGHHYWISSDYVGHFNKS